VAQAVPARVLEAFRPGVLGRGPVRCLEILNGSADAIPLAAASAMELHSYEQVLGALGLKGDLVRWYRDQIYSIEIAARPRSRSESYPSAPEKWRLTDPWSELDVAYSLSQSPRLILCITDTHIQNLYQEWADIERAAQAGDFVLFCMDLDYKDLQVEGGLAGLGLVYYINRLEDLVSMVEVTGRAYCGESFIS
jgi:hypothetical protein